MAVHSRPQTLQSFLSDTCAPNRFDLSLLGRQFTVTRPDAKRCGTSRICGERLVDAYLAAVLDLCSGRLIGHFMVYQVH